jgi:hypothetical protein
VSRHPGPPDTVLTVVLDHGELLIELVSRTRTANLGLWPVTRVFERSVHHASWLLVGSVGRGPGGCNPARSGSLTSRSHGYARPPPMKARFRHLLSSARYGVASARSHHRELARLESETPLFAEAWPLIDSVNGWLGRPEAELLFEMAVPLACGSTVTEIGSYLGRSTTALGLGARRNGSRVVAVDPHTGDRSEVCLLYTSPSPRDRG